MKLKFAIIALLLAISQAHAAGGWDACFNITANPNSPFNASLTLIAIAAAMVVLLIALAHMFGQGMHDEKLIVWSKDELANLVISIVLAASIAGAFAVSCGVGKETVGDDPFRISYNYLDDLSNRAGLATLTRLTKGSLQNQLRATDFIYIGGIPFYGGWGRAYNANYKSISSQKEIAMDILLPSLISLKLQKLALQAIESFALVLLALSIFLRVLPFTRDVGNLCIALCFSIYIVFPLTFALNALALHDDPTLGVPATYSYDYALDGGDQSCAANGSCTLMSIGLLLPQAIFFPNLSLVIVIATTGAIWKLLRKFAA